MSSARNVVLVSRDGYEPVHDVLLQSLIARRIESSCVVGARCERWDERMDELVVGPTGQDEWHVTTSSHPGETIADVVEFAEHFRLDEPSEVEVIEV